MTGTLGGDMTERELRAAVGVADAVSQQSAITVCVADVKPERVTWLWLSRVPVGKITVIAGDPKLGKSMLTTYMAATVTRGGHWPVCNSQSLEGSVIFLSAEDDIADTIRPRLEAHGADVARVHALTMVRSADPETGEIGERMFSLKRDITALAVLLDKHPDCKLIVIDPVTAYLDGTDSHKNADVRGLLAPLAKLAADRKVAIVAVTHLTKGDSGNVLYRAMGSLAFVAAARSVLMVTKDKEDPDRRLLLSAGCNLAREAPGLAYRIATTTERAPVVAWETEAVTISADEALMSPFDDEARGEREEAAEWLRDALSDGPVAAKDIQRMARDAGHAWRTVRRAKDALGVTVEKAEFSGGWRWSLSPKVANYAEDVHTKMVDTFVAIMGLLRARYDYHFLNFDAGQRCRRDIVG